ncbi:MAG: vitamin B12 dependent-methionine synthase activation domain-containing protein [Anaerolineales bacterium]|jgi:hypothetical protein
MESIAPGSTQLTHRSLNESTGILTTSGSQTLPSLTAILRRSKRHRGTNSPLRQVADNALRGAEGLVHPRAIYTKLELESLAALLRTHLPEEILSGTGSLIGVITTIGKQLEERASWLYSAGRFSEGYLLDYVGTLSVANFAQQVTRTLCADQHAVRWAPGDNQQDRTLSAQRMLFEWIPAKEIDIHLTSNNVMIPAKSLSFLLFRGTRRDHKGCLIQCRRCVWNGCCDLQAERQSGQVE